MINLAFTVCQGTHNPRILMLSFADVLDEHKDMFLVGGFRNTVTEDYTQVVKAIAEARLLDWFLRNGCPQTENVGEHLRDLLGVLKEWLESIAPEGMYFGPSVDDGSHYGFFYMPEPLVRYTVIVSTQTFAKSATEAVSIAVEQIRSGDAFVEATPCETEDGGAVPDSHAHIECELSDLTDIEIDKDKRRNNRG